MEMGDEPKANRLYLARIRHRAEADWLARKHRIHLPTPALGRYREHPRILNHREVM
jgi:hypothetical protein